MVSEHLTLSDAPYPGLRPFEPTEADIFFGRERQSDELLSRLGAHRFLAVVGPSGCGKSSLVAAGLMPALDTGFMVKAGSHWRIARLRPGGHPMRNLAEALLSAEILEPERAERSDSHVFLEAALRRGPLGLVEIVHGSALEPDANLLVLVDQFEELFRFTDGASVDEADAFASLLMASASAPGERIYVAITMRSDFLGECAVFRGLPEAINDGLYLTPRLTREECAACITGPARVFGADVEPALVNRLLNDFGPDPDQLPLLQHALLRMWDRHQAERASGAKVVLRVGDYEAIGGLVGCLSTHADEALAELGADDRRVAEIMFRRLSDCETAKRDRRAPARVAEIAALAEVKAEDVIRVADVFRRRGRCFLTPREGIPLDAGTILDIGHESLLRQWRQAASWIADEAERVTLYRRLQEAARDWKRGEGALWGTPNLERALAWRARARPTAAWAARYGTEEEFATIGAFLDAGEKDRDAKRAQAGRMRRGRVLRRMAAAISVASIIGFVVYNSLFVWQHAAYYRAYVSVNGAPRGIGALTTEQVHHRRLSYRIVTAGLWGRTLRMYAVNSRNDQSGDPGPNELAAIELPYYHPTRGQRLRASIWRYEYDREGAIASEYAYTRRNELVQGLVYVGATSGDDGARTAYFINSQGTPGPVKAEDSAYFWAMKVQSDEGFELVRYLGIYGEKVPGAARAFATRNEYDERGRLVVATSLDAKDSPMNDFVGNAIARVEYDEHDNAIAMIALDAQGRTTKTTPGWAIRRSAFDTFGNEIEVEYFDENERPVATSDGWQTARYAYDEHGNVVDERYFDAEGRPTADKQGCHGYGGEYDANDRLLRWTCMSAGGAPTKGRLGHVSMARRYNDRDWVVEETYLDASGNPTLNADGYASQHYELDEQGRFIENEYRGADGQLVTNKNGGAVYATTYDDEKRTEHASSLGIDRQPVLIDEGHSAVSRARDVWGNVMEERYLDRSGNPTRTASGDAGARLTYDTRGQLEETMYLGMAGEIVLCDEGYAGWQAEYDDLGRRTSTRHIGLRREPVIVPAQGIAGWRSLFDQWGREVERMYFDTEENPVTSFQGDAGWRAKYDAVGNQIEIRYVDTKGAPALHAWNDKEKFAGSGYARVERSYDARGNMREEAYFGLDGERVVHPDRFSRVVHEYDERSNRTRTSYFGAGDEPVRNRRTAFHSVQRTYDDHGNAIEVRYFDIDQKTLIDNDEGYARLVRTYDRLGGVNEESLFKADGSRAELDDGVHRIVTIRDELGRRTRIVEYGPQDPPSKLRSSVFKYDDWGNLRETRYLDANDQPFAIKPSSCAIQQWRYDERNEIVEETCLDAGEALSPFLEPGAARIEYKYDPSGHLTEAKYHDTGNRHVAMAQGYAGIQMKYDPAGNMIEESYVDPSGHLAATTLGHSLVRRAYDQFGHVVEEAYFDKDGKPASPVAKMEIIYDALGRRVQDRYLGPGDRHVSLGKTSQHETRYDYDTFGKLEAIRYFDAQGKPTRGFARFYDADWQLCGRWVAQYDVNGNLVGNGTCEREIPRQ
jgi:hypothetical protein